MHKLKTCRFLQIALAVALPCNLILAAVLVARRGEDGKNQLRKFRSVVDIVRAFYVDESKVNYDNLIDGSIDGMLRRLDEHSHYLPPRKYAEATERLEGEYGGIGITFSRENGAFVVQDVLPGGPAHIAGMKRQDRITAVDGTDITKMDMLGVRKLIKGRENTIVELSILRPSTETEMVLKVMRQIIRLPTVRNVHLIEDAIGYFHISQFNRHTTEETGEALKKLAPKMKALVLDLRSNPGGLLGAAQEVCSYFLPTTNAMGLPTVVVTTIPRDKSQEEVLHVLPQYTKYTKIPIAILVNGQSASAAEIVSGCLKDHHRAVLVGEKTFGKGSVQREFLLRDFDKSAIRLTVAKYYTPSRIVIHGKGIQPNFTVKVPGRNALALHRQLTRLQPEPREDGVPDPQLAKAIEILKQKLSNPQTPAE